MNVEIHLGEVQAELSGDTNGRLVTVSALVGDPHDADRRLEYRFETSVDGNISNLAEIRTEALKQLYRGLEAVLTGLGRFSPTT